ncbi:MAG: TlpA disulfide reductase family protein [Bacteroidota bacterium]
MSKIIVCFFLSIVIGNNAIAQQTPASVQKLNIGDTLPKYPLKMMNYPEYTADLQDFKGKILILDFWESSCLSCLESWPKLIKLQDQFKDKIQILTINAHEDQKKIKEVISRQERIYNYKMTLPVSFGDPKIKQLFPYFSLPHIVFIDEDQVVKYIAAGWDLNEITIQNMIDRKVMNIGEKTDNYLNRYKQLYTLNNVGKNDQGQNVLVSTIITPYAPELDGVGTIESRSKKSTGYFGNHSLKDLLRIVYGRGSSLLGAVPNSRVVFKDLDSSKYVPIIDGIRQTQNSYTIQVIAMKYLSPDQIKWKIYNELSSYFDIKAYWGRQKKMCLVISRNKFPIHEYQEGSSTWRAYTIGTTLLKMNKISMQNLVDMMDLQCRQLGIVGFPVIDETNFKGFLGMIEFESPNKVIDYQVLSKELAKYGLHFSFEERDVDVLIISKAGETSSLVTR